MKKQNSKQIRISIQADELITKKAKELGISKAQLLDRLIKNVIDKFTMTYGIAERED